MNVSIESSLEPFIQDLNAIYLNGPETAAHTQLMKARGLVQVKVDQDLLRRLRSDCIILEPMQSTDPLIVGNGDSRLAGYRQAENGLFMRMALLLQTLGPREAQVSVGMSAIAGVGGNSHSS